MRGSSPVANSKRSEGQSLVHLTERFRDYHHPLKMGNQPSKSHKREHQYERENQNWASFRAFVAAGLTDSSGRTYGGHLSANGNFQLKSRGGPPLENWQAILQTFLKTGSLVACSMTVLQGSSAMEQIGHRISKGLEAGIALNAPTSFPRTVRDYIYHRLSETEATNSKHLYFLYHPDTDWHAKFHRLMSKTGMHARFLGVCEDLNELCAWMAFIRTRLARPSARRFHRRARFHLLIPTYRPLVIEKPLSFDENLLPLTIHGMLHDSQNMVWLNLPSVQDYQARNIELIHVGNIATRPPPPTLWQRASTFLSGLISNPEPQPVTVLGQAQEDPQMTQQFRIHLQTHHRSGRGHRRSRAHA
jgi:hypothetical protein